MSDFVLARRSAHGFKPKKIELDLDVRDHQAFLTVHLDGQSQNLAIVRMIDGEITLSVRGIVSPTMLPLFKGLVTESEKGTVFAWPKVTVDNPHSRESGGPGEITIIGGGE